MSDTRPIRVLLVDDHAVVRSGLGAFLTAFDDLELAGEASSGERAIALCQKVQPDVVLMDLVMPGMDGATATRKIRQQCPHIQVIALTSFKEQESVQGALQAGAIGYLLASVGLTKFLTLGLAVSLMGLNMARVGAPISPVELIIFPGMALAGVVMTVILLKHIQEH